MKQYVLLLKCLDRPGIVHEISGGLFQEGCNIEESAQFSESGTAVFYMRARFSAPDRACVQKIATALKRLYNGDEAGLAIHDMDKRSRVLILVSKHGHCLNDLLFRQRSGLLNMDVAGVVSNHPDFRELAASYDIPFHHFPVTPQTRAEQEGRILDLVASTQSDLVVLARYMQILSDRASNALSGRAINIHHSFLPGFKGARPYYQAYDRGVKLIGATAHYVTSELDEGPIIEQDVARVSHSLEPQALTDVGRDVECMTLARAVKWHTEHRIILNGRKTIVFA